MKVLLINLPYYRLMRLRHFYFPVGLGYLAAVARDAGHDVTIYDMEKDAGASHFRTNLLMRNRTVAFPLFSRAIDDDEHYVWGELKNVLRDIKPDLVGLSIWSTVFPAAVKAAGIIKKMDRSICVVAGGSHPTLCDDEVARQPNIDIVIRGEGEAVFAQLLRSIASGQHDLENIKGITYRTKDNLIQRNLPQALIADIDSIAPPAYETVLDPSLFHAQDWGCLVTARGCAEDCAFCCSKEIWGRKVRSRDMSHVFSEMSQLYKDRGVTFFTFFDDTFTSNKDRVAGLCDRISRSRLCVNWFAHGRVDNMDEGYAKQLRKGGCYAMQFGVESGSQDLLNAMRKRYYLEDMLRVRALFRKHGILFWATFLLGFPGETEQELNKTYNFLKQLAPDLASINVFVPYPGSAGWKDLLRMGRSVEWKNLSPHSYDAKFNNVDSSVWQSSRDKIEALADSYNMRTLRSWQWTYRLVKPRLVRACREFLS